MSFQRYAGLLMAGLLSIPLSAVSAESDGLGPIVITATRTVTPADEVASSVTVINRQAIEASGHHRVVELLRTVPGVAVAQAGGQGQQSSLFMRGSNSNHVLVLIDGIEINDPSNPSGQVDFAHLLVDDIERIEIVRGPQSTLFGSDAIGGVIQIFTRRDRSGASLALGSGSFDTHRLAARMGAHTAHGSEFAVSVKALKTEGISAANEDRGHGKEADGYENMSLSLHGALRPAAGWRLGSDLRLQQTEAELDQFIADYPPPFPFVADDPDTESETDQLFVRLHAERQSNTGRWTQRWQLSHSDHERLNRNGPAGANPYPNEARFEGQKWKLEWRHELLASETQRLSFGLETENERMRSAGVDNKSARTHAAYLQDQIRFHPRFSATVGLRHDDHEGFGGATTGRIAPLWVANDHGLRFKASVGTGFKAPSLAQRFEDFPPFFFANPDLDPERSRGWDFGLEQAFNGGSFGLTYYRNDIQDLIGFVFDPDILAGTLDNIQRAETRGYETVLSLQPHDRLGLNAQFTRSHAHNKDTGQRLLRRPEKTAALQLLWHPARLATQLGLSARYVGERDDIDGVGDVHQLDSHTVADLSARFALTPDVELDLRVDNLFDTDYEEIIGYGTVGRSGYIGLRWTSQP